MGCSQIINLRRLRKVVDTLIEIEIRSKHGLGVSIKKKSGMLPLVVMIINGSFTVCD